MSLHRWSEIAAEQMNPLVSRKVIHGETITIARLLLRKGAIVPMHSHANEQIANLESGKLHWVVNGEETIMQGGESFQIAPNVPHMVEALEDCVVIDVFSPVREDWIRGDDAYLR
ncbi:MAG: cupin domain-containing protein [Acidobacteriota bacterium]|nr:cupin domain-containing protein [Acidobacteriota bacterium]